MMYIDKVKESRVRIDAIVEGLKTQLNGREHSLAFTSLQLGFMRLGKLMSCWGGQNPYPESLDPSSSKIEPMADTSTKPIEFPPGDHISAIKHTRLLVDNEITTLKKVFADYYKQYDNGYAHEAEICIDAMQDAKMWLGMVLNVININQQKMDAFLEENTKQMWAQVSDAYDRYGKTTDYKNFQGNPMPKFEELSDTIKKAWWEAVQPFDRSRNNAASAFVREGYL